MEPKSVTDVISILNAIISDNKPKALPIPPPLILTGGFTRSGLSAKEMAKEVILRQQEAGVITGALPDGSENVSEKMELIRMEVIVRHLLENAKFTVVLPQGIPVFTIGVSAVGPVQSQGFTTSFGVGTAIIQ